MAERPWQNRGFEEPVTKEEAEHERLVRGLIQDINKILLKQ